MKEAHVQLAHIKDKLPDTVKKYIDQLGIVPPDIRLNYTHYSRFFYSSSAVVRFSEDKKTTRRLLR